MTKNSAVPSQKDEIQPTSTLKRTTTRNLPLQASKFQPEELLSTAIIWAVAAVVTGVLLWLLSDIFWHGIGQISWEFLTTSPSNAG